METIILPINDQSIQKAKEILLNGGIVGIPTETVYGLAGVGTNPQAVKKIFEVKGRPSDNPLIAHVHKDFDFLSISRETNTYYKKLKSAFTPGPLTMVFESNGAVCTEALAGGDTVAIRVPSHEGCQQLLKAINLPLVAPSANLSKHVSPVTAEHVYEDLKGKIPLILDGGKCNGGIESTVLDVTGETPRILRSGLITKEMIESVVGCCLIAEHKESDKVKSPGVKYSHYMPKCATARYEESELNIALAYYDEQESLGEKVYIMCSERIKALVGKRKVLSLGSTPNEMASLLYERLREAEKVATLLIAIKDGASGGVYDGLFNRLDKACKKI